MKCRYLWFVLFASAAALATSALVGDGRLWGQIMGGEPISISSESFVYLLELGGQQVGEYVECAGLGSYHEVEEQTVVTAAGSVVMEGAPGVLRWRKITLRRTTPGDTAVWQWRRTMEKTGLSSSLRDGRITLYGSGSSVPLAQWTFTEGWPASLVFDGSQEELVIVHNGLERIGATSTSTATRS